MPLAHDPAILLGKASFDLERYEYLYSLLDQEVPSKVVDKNVLLATWNISGTRRARGGFTGLAGERTR